DVVDVDMNGVAGDCVRYPQLVNRVYRYCSNRCFLLVFCSLSFYYDYQFSGRMYFYNDAIVWRGVVHLLKQGPPCIALYSYVKQSQPEEIGDTCGNACNLDAYTIWHGHVFGVLEVRRGTVELHGY